ncbi:hypothetical protein GCM10022200_14160 [Microbacterium awajiense]|uniref:NYN domain-containing protein n=1 Tax=Microbacterium awajiense TaxID=415214 RepID=A0ABP7AGZ2_9MICO
MSSQYRKIFGQAQTTRDWDATKDGRTPDPEVVERIARARVAVTPFVDFATSFGTVTLKRAYADWTSPFTSGYGQELGLHAVELVQMVRVTNRKNAADIRLAIDAVEDVVSQAHLTHVVFVSADSDFAPLARRCRRLGKHVIGIGTGGPTSIYLPRACESSTRVSVPGPAEHEEIEDDRTKASTTVASPAEPEGDDIVAEPGRVPLTRGSRASWRITPISPRSSTPTAGTWCVCFRDSGVTSMGTARAEARWTRRRESNPQRCRI